MNLLALIIAAVAAKQVYLRGGRKLGDGLAYVDATRKLAMAQRWFAVDRYLDWTGGAPEVQA